MTEKRRRRLLSFGAASLTLSLLFSISGLTNRMPFNDPAGADATVALSDPAQTTGLAHDDDAVISSTDIEHEHYTATTGLDAHILVPANGFVDGPAARLVVTTTEGAGVDVHVNGLLVARNKIGKRTVDRKAHTATYEYFGVAFNPGPNAVQLAALGADGARGTATDCLIFGPGPATTLHATTPNGLHADGHSGGTLDVHGTDTWGHPASGAIVHVTVTTGDATLGGVSGPPAVAASPATAGTISAPSTAADVHLDGDGIGHVVVIPGDTAGNVSLSLASGAAADSESLYVAPYVRKAFVTGVATVGAGSVPGDIDGDGLDENGGSRRGRVGLSGSGGIGKNATATFAYETANRLSESSTYGPFVDDPSDRSFETSGDTSMRHDGAISNNRLYARVEDGRDTVTYGRSTVETGLPGEGDGFRQTINGVKAELSSKNGREHAMLFKSSGDAAYAREIYAPSGLASLGHTAHGDIVVASETITLFDIDRRTSVLVSESALVRNTDYTIDYASGAVTFVDVPLPTDALGNPQLLLVTYQYAGLRTGAGTTGGRAEVSLDPHGKAKLGVGYVNTVTGSGNYTLATQDLTGLLPGGSWTFAHVMANGASPANTLSGEVNETPQVPGLAVADGTGSAVRASATTRLGANTFSAGYDAASLAFQNPFGGFVIAPGLTDARASWQHSRSGTEYGMTYDAQRNSGYGPASAQGELALNARKKFASRLTLSGGLDVRNHSGQLAPIAYASPSVAATPSSGLLNPAPAPSPTVLPQTIPNSPSGSVTQAHASIDYRIRNNLDVSAQRTTDIAGNAEFLDPTNTSAEVDYHVGGTRTYLRELWTSQPEISFANVASAASAATASTNSTIFGIDQTISPVLTATTQYQLEHTANGVDAYSTIGVKEKIAIGKHLTGNASLQRASGIDSSTAAQTVNAIALLGSASAPGTSSLTTSTGYDVYGLDLAYASGGSFRASGSYQVRTGNGAGSTLTIGAGGALGGGFSLLGASSQAHGYGIDAANQRVGIAWRPEDSDRGAALLEIKRDNGIDDGSSTSDVAEYEQVYRPTRRLQLTGRFAYKLDGDAIYAARASLYALRIGEKIGDRYDIAMETRHLTERDVPGASQESFAVEAGTRVLPSLRLAFGYNFDGAADPDLMAQPTRRGIYVTATTVIDRIFGWGDPRN